jgi:O-acetyl-ADP-ribose deacetylase (regulator of RNase III)/uncharacterized protein YwgA
MSKINIITGNLFESGAQTLVNTVNTEGVMGKGVALQFRKRFPDMYEDYVVRCQRGEVRLGEPYIYQGLLPPWIINFPTKYKWRSISRAEDIEAGLAHLDDHLAEWGVETIALPPLGCGEGGLEWQVVGQMIYRHAQNWGIPVTMFAPYGTPDEQLDPHFLDERRLPLTPLRLPPAWVAIAAIVERLQREPYRPHIGRTMFQKIAYFATIRGLPTNLEFTKSSFGPFAGAAKTMERRLIQNGLLTEHSPKRGQRYDVVVGPQYKDAVISYQAELSEWKGTIEEVAQMFLRFHTTRQAEIAATVHFAASELASSRDKRPSEAEVYQAVKAWKARRDPPLPDDEVAAMVRNLNVVGLLDLQASDLPLPKHAVVDELDLVEIA